jgi:cytoskeletal protein CcmA (bactofilin family)
MRQERGHLAGGVVINEPVELLGSVGGDVTVADGGKLYLRGTIYGDLIIDRGARVHIFGQIQGNVRVNKHSKVVHSGVIGGDLINDGGRLFVEKISKIGGKLKTNSGRTKVEALGATRPPPED